MPKPRSDSGRKNLISENLIELRKQHGLSQRDLARELQIHGCDMDKNVITRIETQKRQLLLNRKRIRRNTKRFLERSPPHGFHY